MIETLPPLMRRIVAIALFVLVTLGAITQVIVPLIEANQAARSDLANVREALARALAIRAGPEPRQIVPFPDRAALHAPSAQAARQRLAGHVAARAAASGLQLIVRDTPGNGARAPASVTLGISVTGSREALLEWMSDLERGMPACRFRSWQLTDLGQPMMPSVMPPPVQPQPQPAESAPAAPPPAPERILRLEATIVSLWAGAL